MNKYPPSKARTDADGIVLDQAVVNMLLAYYDIDPDRVWLVKDWGAQWKVIDKKGRKFYFPKQEPAARVKVDI